MVVYIQKVSSEKAGVGGSIPSLATIKFNRSRADRCDGALPYPTRPIPSASAAYYWGASLCIQ